MLEPLGRDSRLGMAYASLSALHMLGWRHDEAIEVGRQAIALATEIGDDEIHAFALANVGSALVWEEGKEVARGTLEQAIAIADAAGLHEHAARALHNLAVYGLEPGEPDDEPLIERAIAYARDHELGGHDGGGLRPARPLPLPPRGLGAGGGRRPALARDDRRQEHRRDLVPPRARADPVAPGRGRGPRDAGRRMGPRAEGGAPAPRPGGRRRGSSTCG